MLGRLDKLEKILTDNTVLYDWFSPFADALEKVRYSTKRFPTLTMPLFILLNCMRQLNACTTLREHIQTLFHLDDDEEIKIPLVRSTYSDALANGNRLKITEETFKILYQSAVKRLPDRLAGINNIEGREVYAMDGTYQKESCHFNALSPSEGGTDSSKGHLTLTVFNLRPGLPVDSDIDTSSISEIRFVKECWNNSHLASQKNSLWIVDRGFIDAVHWDARKGRYGVTCITRMKSNLYCSVIAPLKVAASNKKPGIKRDRRIDLNSSKEPWHLIEYKSDTGETYEYLTNDLTLGPGVIAFLYHRRWDEEKYFDNYKNDMANAKAWGKSVKAIKQHAIIAMITFVLTRLFSYKYAKEFGFPSDGTTQEKRHKKKLENHFDGQTKDPFRAFHTNLSKVTKQVWRFLRSCMLKKSRQRIYEGQLRPMMMAYL